MTTTPKLTKLQNVQKDVMISFFIVNNEPTRQHPQQQQQSKPSIVSQYFPLSNVNASSRSSSSQSIVVQPSKELISSVVVSQKKVNDMFDVDSLVTMALSAKVQSPTRYKGWSVLQQDGNNNGEESNAVEEIRLSDAMKRYHELPISLPIDQFTRTAILTFSGMLKAGSDKNLPHVLNKEEILETVTLCNYLGLKAFVK